MILLLFLVQTTLTSGSRFEPVLLLLKCKSYFSLQKKKKATFEFCLNYSHLNHMTTKGTEIHF